MEIKFTKMHGLGNDYIYINAINNSYTKNKEFIKSISNRNTGIGGDGVIFIEKSTVADFKMTMYNSDGSVGKMCGNGIRCFGKYCFDKKLTNKKDLMIETASGIREVYLSIVNGTVTGARVNMKKPILKGDLVPINFEKDQMINESVSISNVEYKVTSVSMGNPHAIIFVESLKLDINNIGIEFEQSEIYPESVNTNFVKVIDRDNIDLRVFERGSGETLACGTGACASAYACILLDKTNSDVNVRLLGGNLQISLIDGEIWMEGPASTVFEGVLEMNI